MATRRIFDVVRKGVVIIDVMDGDLTFCVFYTNPRPKSTQKVTEV
jgi:hypothetical protein